MKKISEGLYSCVSNEELNLLLSKQLNSFFLINEEELETLYSIQKIVLERLKMCICEIDNKYFKKDGKTYFSPYHSGQYLIYLYLYSNECLKHTHSNTLLKDKIYYLNKILHSCDIFYEIELPEVFFLEHPVGTVLGRAKYGNHFFAMQGCTVGGNKGFYPVIGNNVKMFSNSKIIGNSKIGNDVLIGANCYIKDYDIPDNVIVFGQYPNLIIKNKNG